MLNNIYSFLGLAAKAGQLASGESSCERAIRSGIAYLVIVADDASQNTKKKFTDMCSYRGIDIKFFGQKECIGRYTGKEIRSVVAVLDQGFTKRLIEMVECLDLERGGERIGKS